MSTSIASKPVSSIKYPKTKSTNFTPIIRKKNTDESIFITKTNNRKHKVKWIKKFMEAYAYEADWSDNAVDENITVFLEARVNHRAIGYICLVDYSELFKTVGNEKIFFAANAYVQPQWRHKGVLKKLLREGIAKYQSHGVILEPEIAKNNCVYYTSLGFTNMISSRNSNLLVLLDSYANNRRR